MVLGGEPQLPYTLTLAEYPPAVPQALDCRDENHGGEGPGDDRDVVGQEQEERPRQDGLEPLGHRAAEMEAPLRQALPLQPLQNAREGQKHRAVQVIGEKERDQGQTGIRVLNGERDEETTVNEEVCHDVDERAELRALAAEASDLSVEAVEEPVQEPEDERHDVQTEGYRYQTERADTEACRGKSVSGDAPLRQDAGGKFVEGFGALPEFLIEHSPIISAGARLRWPGGSRRRLPGRPRTGSGRAHQIDRRSVVPGWCSRCSRRAASVGWSGRKAGGEDARSSIPIRLGSGRRNLAG